jgi:hypothetical protein
MRQSFFISVCFQRILTSILLFHLALIYNFLFAERCQASLSDPATIYYVSIYGSDSAKGTRESPWRTPGHASRKLKPGDTLIIKGGRYILSEYDKDILSPSSGKDRAWITIKGESGYRPILAGRDNLAMAIDLSGSNYVRIENLEITHDQGVNGEMRYFRDGLVIAENPSDHIVLKGLYIHHLDEFGINFQDIEHLEVINCQIEYAGFGAIGGPAGQRGGWRNIKIDGCRLAYSGHYYQGGDGTRRPYDRPDGFGIESSAGPIEIIKTVAEHNRGDGLDSKAQNTTIRQCIVANNSCDGIKLWGDGSLIENTLIYGRGDGDPEQTPWSAIVIDTETKGARFEITNVTVDDRVGGNYLMYVQYDHPGVSVSLDIRNSIFCGRGEHSPVFIAPDVNLMLINNLFYLPESEPVLIFGETEFAAEKIGSLGQGNLYADPLFVSPAWGKVGNYKLKQQSLAIDAGTSKGAPPIDLEGLPRKGLPAIGAYENGTPE